MSEPMLPEWRICNALEVAKTVRLRAKIKTRDYREKGRYPVIDQGKGPVSGYTDNEDAVFTAELPLILFGDHTREWKYLDFPFAPGADGTKLLKPAFGDNPKFLFYALSAAPLSNLGYSRHFKLLKEVDLGIPPLPEQQKIAAILSSVDAVIEKTEAVIEQLEVVKKGMMQELLTRGMPGRHSRFKKTEVGEIPENWGCFALGALIGPKNLQTGPFGSQLKANEYVAAGVPVIMPKDLANQRVRVDSIARISETRATDLIRHRVRAGDILFSRRGDIGRCGLITPKEHDWVCGTGCLRARIPPKSANARFLLHAISWTPSRQWLNDNAVGQTMLNLNTKILSRLPLCLPPLAEQKEIAAILDSVDERIAKERQTISELRNTKSALMSNLLTGKIRVNN